MNEFLYACRYFIVRFGVALGFLLAVYNPSQYCFSRWVLAEPRDERVALKVLVGVLLACAFVYMATTTHKTLGKIGLFLCLAVIGAIFWLLMANVNVDWTNSALVAAAQVCVASVFAFGLSAANLNRRLSGQVMTNAAGPTQVEGLHHH